MIILIITMIITELITSCFRMRRVQPTIPPQRAAVNRSSMVPADQSHLPSRLSGASHIPRRGSIDDESYLNNSPVPTFQHEVRSHHHRPHSAKERSSSFHHDSTTGIQRPSSALGRKVSLAKPVRSSSALDQPYSPRDRNAARRLEYGPEPKEESHPTNNNHSSLVGITQGSQGSTMPRSRSLGFTDICKHNGSISVFGNTNSGINAEDGVLLIQRDKSGHHSVVKPIRQNSEDGNCNKRPPTPTRINISPDQILPDKPRIIGRSHTHESPLGDSAALTVSPSDDHEVKRSISRLHSAASNSSLDLSNKFDDYPEPPPENAALNNEMEQLFEQYRKLEYLGVDRTQSTDDSLDHSDGPSARFERNDDSELSYGSGRPVECLDADELIYVSTDSHAGSVSGSTHICTREKTMSREDVLSTRGSATSSPTATRKQCNSVQSSGYGRPSSVKRVQPSSGSTPKPTASTGFGKSRRTTPMEPGVYGKITQVQSCGNGGRKFLDTTNGRTTTTGRQTPTVNQTHTGKQSITGRQTPTGTQTHTGRQTPTGRQISSTSSSGYGQRSKTPVQSTARTGIITPTPRPSAYDVNSSRTTTPTPATHFSQNRSRNATPVQQDELESRSRSTSITRSLQGTTQSTTPRRMCSQETLLDERPSSRSSSPIKNLRAYNLSERARSVTPSRVSKQTMNGTHDKYKYSQEDMLADVDPPKDRLLQTLELLNKGTENMPLEVLQTVNSLVQKHSKPRRDDDSNKPRTKIPAPVSFRHNNPQRYGSSERMAWEEPPVLKRFDSGVDINNMSPTETSFHEEEQWQDEILKHSEAYSLGAGLDSEGYSLKAGRDSNGFSHYQEYRDSQEYY